MSVVRTKACQARRVVGGGQVTHGEWAFNMLAAHVGGPWSSSSFCVTYTRMLLLLTAWSESDQAAPKVGKYSASVQNKIYHLSYDTRAKLSPHLDAS